MRQMAKYTWMDYERNKDTLRDLNSQPIFDKILNMKPTAPKLLTIQIKKHPTLKENYNPHKSTNCGRSAK
jgi:hypothetical protein